MSPTVLLNEPTILIYLISALSIVTVIVLMFFFKANRRYQHKKHELQEKIREFESLYSQFNQQKEEHKNLENQYAILNLEYQKSHSEAKKNEDYYQALNERYHLLEKHNQSVTSALHGYEDNIRILTEKNTQLTRQNEELHLKITQTLEQNLNLAEKKEEYSKYIATLESRLESESRIKDQNEENLIKSQKMLEERLNTLCERFVNKGAEGLNEQSQKTMTAVITPLREELDKFRNMIYEGRKEQQQRDGAFANELKNLKESSLSLTKEAQELANSLRHGVKSQGMWGEQQLERVLESSGLVKGREYQREVAVHPDTHLDMKHDKTVRPDAVINLPDNHCIIIDAKCSLSAYTNFINAITPKDKEQALKEHIQSIKNHIRELKDKGYSEYYRESLNSPSFVFMFVPFDGALSEALYNDATLYETASKQDIYLVSPSSLLPALRVVTNLWMLSEQTKRVNELINSAQSIFEKFKTVEDRLETIIRSHDQEQQLLIDLRTSMITGKGNLKDKIIKFSRNGQRHIRENDGNTIDGAAVMLEKNRDNRAANDSLM